jgi:hypothetical protein
MKTLLLRAHHPIFLQNSAFGIGFKTPSVQPEDGIRGLPILLIIEAPHDINPSVYQVRATGNVEDHPFISIVIFA